MIEAISTALPFLALIGGIGAIFLLLLSVSGLFISRTGPLWNFFGRYAVWFSLLVATVATTGSLFYSEILGYDPCKLCWFQRIFMYPQVFLFAIALWRKDRTIADYSLVLSIIGGVIAAYHYLLQLGLVSGVACGAIGYSVSCSQRFVVEYGYITIPMMALTAFALITLLMIIRKIANNQRP